MKNNVAANKVNAVNNKRIVAKINHVALNRNNVVQPTRKDKMNAHAVIIANARIALLRNKLNLTVNVEKIARMTVLVDVIALREHLIVNVQGNVIAEYVNVE
jgi:hypothetical protein